ncbi:MAG: proline--tRNA ligase [Burkholderiales bacterium]
MRVKQFFLSTLKEAPAEAELASHKLMLRAGLIKKLGSGLYTWMPLGLRVLRKVENIVREEMDRAGAIELLMPAVQPAELWQESGRWGLFGPQMLKIKDRHDRDFCFGPTHEEVISDIVRREVKSYRLLPLNLYQIQTKFRDEIRPRFGVMRAREFVMKDAYSFHADKASLDQTYQAMHDAYSRVFERLGLKFRPVAADPGAIGGTCSHEFHVLADSGEDAIAYCPTSDYAANVELAEAIAPGVKRGAALQSINKVPTPGKKTCEAVAELLKLPLQNTVKAIVVMAGKVGDEKAVMLLLRGDHELNEIKAAKIPELRGLRLASGEEIQKHLMVPVGYMGPIALAKKPLIIADRSVDTMSDFVCGANDYGYHLTGVNWGRDLPEPNLVADIRSVVAGDPSPDGKGELQIARGIEVGHIFQLRTKYSKAMGVTFLDESGKSKVMEMGCYGIGVSRIVAAAIEQNYDERGIKWPRAMAPFDVYIAPIGYKKSPEVQVAAQKLHDEVAALGLEVLLDDRDERPGVMFADQELIGIPHRIVVSERGLKVNILEYQQRGEYEALKLDLQSVLEKLKLRS